MSHVNHSREQTLIEKLRGLPPEKLSEVEDFVDFLHTRSEDRKLTAAAAALSQAALSKIWDNEVDAAYDKL